MGAEMMSDFVVASNRHCFFCLNQIKEVNPGLNLASPPLAEQTSSLQYFTRYLKMDLKKVFHDKGQVSPELLAKVEKAKLKVELCEECRCLSERFSKVYRQLEKMELELGSTLRLIYGKLAGADATEKIRDRSAALKSNWEGLLEVLDVLRGEAMRKSSCKLADTPRVKIQHLSRKKIEANQFRKQTNFRSDHKSSRLLATNTDFVSDGRVQMSSVEMESLTGECLSDNDNGNNFSDNDVDDSNLEPMEEEADTRNEKIQREENPDCNIIVTENMMVDKEVVSRKRRNMVGTGKFSVSAVTGKHKCSVCYKEFNSSQAFKRHYETAHIKLRFKCVSCNKLFSQNSSLRLHQRTSQSCSMTKAVPKYKCQLCEKSFVHKHVLQDHLDGIHYKLQKYECNLCGNKFNSKTLLNRHRRKSHNI